MNSDVLIIGVVVGCVNYLFRYLPLRLRAGHASDASRAGQRAARYHRHRLYLRAAGGLQRAGNSRDARRLLPTLVGFAVLGLAFWKTRSIIVPTLLRPGLRCCLENRHMAISLKYQF
jgi:hypothetical protein